MHRASHDTISTRKPQKAVGGVPATPSSSSSTNNGSTTSPYQIPLASPNGTHRKPVPGRTRRRHTRRRGTKRLRRWLNIGWCKDLTRTFSSLFLAVILWYSLGVISIGSSKLLLSQDGGVPPLYLTLQQLLIGSTLLRLLLKLRFLGSSGLLPWPTSTNIPTNHHSTTNHHHHPATPGNTFQSRFSALRRQRFLPTMLPRDYYQPLVLAGVYFSLGFLATNYGFYGSSPSYVETIKAAEPITSAAIAVWWGIEVLSRPECMSLGAIVTGVLFSTMGNHHTDATPVHESFRACMIVMGSNLCFSFRGLYQKLLRATSEGNAQALDDLNLQFRMQQLGCYLLALPVLFLNGPGIAQDLWELQTMGALPVGRVLRYLLLALLNGCAFASYNLASTYILSRISVVHHAALNCIRRIFAIIVTSILFEIPITLLGGFGIVVSFFGFMSFTHFKVQRQRQPKPVSSLLPVSATA